MENPRWLNVIAVGLVLAAMAFGYFLLSNRFFQSRQQNKSQVVQRMVQTSPQSLVAFSPKPSVLGENNSVSQPIPTPTPISIITPSPSPLSAYGQIVRRNQANLKILPKTGFPDILLGIFSIGAIVAGLGLSKFPN